MKLEKQVTSLAVSQRLNELGVRQKSLFEWSVPIPKNGKSIADIEALKEQAPELYLSSNNHWGECYKIYSAYTVSELRELIKEEIERQDCGYQIEDFSWERDKPTIWFGGKEVISETEADTRGIVLIKMREQELLTNKEL